MHNLVSQTRIERGNSWIAATEQDHEVLTSVRSTCPCCNVSFDDVAAAGCKAPLVHNAPRKLRYR